MDREVLFIISKKHVLCLLLIIVAISAISQVSAADLNETDVAISEDVISVENNQNSADDVLSEAYCPTNFTDLKSFLETAPDGATVELSGTYEFSSVITISSGVTIIGDGDGAIIKHEAFNSKKFSFFNIKSSASNVVLSNLKFVGANSNAISWNGNNGVITNCEFSKNIVEGNSLGGAALAVFGSNCNITNCSFIENYARAGTGGALLLKASSCLVSDCTFTSNHCANSGGAIAAYNEDSNIINCKFEANYAENNITDIQGGGAIFSSCDGLTIDACEFIGNNALGAFGGAVCLGKRNTVQNSYFNANNAVAGNDIYVTSKPSFLMSNFFLLDYNETEEQAVYGMDLATTDNNNTFNITKIDSIVNFISTGMVFDYGTSGSINVKVDGGFIELKNIKVLNHPEAKITYSNNVLTVSGLGVGSYTLHVVTTPDENHYAVDSDLGITVNPATAVIQASKITVALKRGTLWTIRIVDSKNNNPIAGMQVSLKVYTGTKFITVNLITDAKGEANYQTKGLAKGTHKVVISASHSGYNFNAIISSIKVVKPKPLTFSIVKRVNDKKGSLLSFIVKDKKTKKGVNGVKISLLIYTGKKYVTISLKTKKVGKFSGAVGYSTNKFSVGKHKVKIIPSSITYTGSKSTSMIIKKAAKNIPVWERKVSG